MTKLSDRFSTRILWKQKSRSIADKGWWLRWSSSLLWTPPTTNNKHWTKEHKARVLLFVLSLYSRRWRTLQWWVEEMNRLFNGTAQSDGGVSVGGRYFTSYAMQRQASKIPAQLFCSFLMPFFYFYLVFAGSRKTCCNDRWWGMLSKQKNGEDAFRVFMYEGVELYIAVTRFHFHLLRSKPLSSYCRIPSCPIQVSSFAAMK